jgi:hypothetical protein
LNLLAGVSVDGVVVNALPLDGGLARLGGEEEYSKKR